MQKMVWLKGFGLNCLWDIVGKHQKNFWVNKVIPKSCIFKHLKLMVAPKYIIHSIFWKSQVRPFRCIYISCRNWDWYFAVSSRKYIKWAISDISMTMMLTLEVNITRRMSPFFSSTFWALSVTIFQFWISKT